VPIANTGEIMNADELRALQAPVKARYREDPASAMLTMRARGRLDPKELLCHVEATGGAVAAGLHSFAGGDGQAACAGDMLLQALAACAGVTLRAVATAMSIPVRGGTVTVEGDLDFRGTLGVSKEAPIGFQALRLHFELNTDATEEQCRTLLKLTERYCVVFQTLQKPPALTSTLMVREG
jgi:uncharacterized OsmC-like protein